MKGGKTLKQPLKEVCHIGLILLWGLVLFDMCDLNGEPGAMPMGCQWANPLLVGVPRS